MREWAVGSSYNPATVASTNAAAATLASTRLVRRLAAFASAVGLLLAHGVCGHVSRGWHAGLPGRRCRGAGASAARRCITRVVLHLRQGRACAHTPGPCTPLSPVRPNGEAWASTQVLSFSFLADVTLNLVANSNDSFRPFLAKWTNIFDLTHTVISPEQRNAQCPMCVAASPLLTVAGVSGMSVRVPYHHPRTSTLDVSLCALREQRACGVLAHTLSPCLSWPSVSPPSV